MNIKETENEVMGNMLFGAAIAIILALAVTLYLHASKLEESNAILVEQLEVANDALAEADAKFTSISLAACYKQDLSYNDCLSQSVFVTAPITRPVSLNQSVIKTAPITRPVLRK